MVTPCISLLVLLLVIPEPGSLFLLDNLENEVPTLKFLKNEDLDKWEAPKEMQKRYPYYLSGFDEENRPIILVQLLIICCIPSITIWVLEFGKWDVRAGVEKGGKHLQDLDKYFDQWMYRMLNSTKIKSTPENSVHDVISIVDMDNYSLWQLNSLHTISFLLKKARDLRDAMQFVETGYVLNANFMAQALVSMVRPILGKDMERVEVYGTNKESWIPLLLKKLPADQLSPAYGGKKDFAALKSYG